MPYWIHRNGENVGPYDLPQLQEMLNTGQATAGDLAIEEGSQEWSTVGDLAGTAPLPAAEPVMAELVSTAPVEEPTIEAATAKTFAETASTASSSKLKFAVIGLVALLVVGGGVFAYSKFSGDGKNQQNQAKNNPGNNTPSQPDNTPKPGGNKPGELPKLPEKTDPNSNTNLPAPLPPPPIDPPVNTGDNKLTPQPAPEAIKHIPANTIGVASINLGQLLKKAGGYQALLDKVMQAAGPEANDPMIKNMAGLFAPDKLAANFGIGINDPLLVFTTGNMKVGVLLPVADANKLELAIPNIAVMLEAELPELQPADGYKFVAFPQQAAGVALGAKAVLILIDTMAADRGQPKDLTQELDQLMKLPAAAGGQLAQVRPNFAKHAQMPYDGALWMNSAEVIKIALRDMSMPDTDIVEMELMKSVMGGMGDELAAGLSFQQGRIVIEALMAYEDKFYGSWGNEATLDAGILDVIPGNSIAVLTQSMNMDVIRTFVDKRMEEVTKTAGGQGLNEFSGEMDAMLTNFGLTSESLIELPAGDLAISLVGLNAGTPEILFSMNVSDPLKTTEVLNKIKATPVYAGLQQAGFDAIIQGNVLHIAPLSLKNSIEKGQNGNPLSLEARKLLGENDSAMHFSIASLAGALPPMGPAEMAMIQQFKGITVTGNTEPAGQRFTASINMTNPNANVLQTLVNQAFQQAMNMQRQLDDIMGIPDDPDAEDSGSGGFPAPPDFGKDDFPPNPGGFPAPPDAEKEEGGDDFPRKTEEKTLPTKPSPFPLPPNFGGESKSGKEGALPPPTPAPTIPEPNPFNPK